MREHQEPFPLMGRCDAADGPREKTQRAPSKKKKKNKLKRCSNPSLPYFSFFCDDRDRYEERKKIIFKLSVVNEMKHTHTHTHTKARDFFFCCREKRISVCVSGLCERVQEKVGPPRGVGRWETKEKMLRALFAADSVESQHDGCHPVQYNFN